MLRITTARGFSELTKNIIRSSHGHSTPSLKILCKSVQPFSRNLANKETKKETNRSKTIPRPPTTTTTTTTTTFVALGDPFLGLNYTWSRFLRSVVQTKLGPSVLWMIAVDRSLYGSPKIAFQLWSMIVDCHHTVTPSPSTPVLRKIQCAREARYCKTGLSWYLERCQK